MLIARFVPGSAAGVSEPEPLWGLLEDDSILSLQTSPFAGVHPGKGRYRLDEVNLLAPVSPSKIAAIGWNYEEHIREMGSTYPEEPLIFLKAPSAVVGPGVPILLPPESERVDFEAELAVVIGKQCRRVSRDEAQGVVLGYTGLNDVTARDLQKKDGQFSRAKSYDTFCPTGPWIQTELDPTSVRVKAFVNGEVRQDDNTSTMLFDPLYLVEYVSAAMTLYPGDVIATGTPSGVGPLSPGDEITIRIEGIGDLTNTVQREVI